MLIFTTLYCIIYLLNALYNLVIRKRKLVTKKQFIIVGSLFLISSIGLLILYYPKELIPSGYSIDHMYISVYTFNSDEERELKIKDKEACLELGRILKEYKCTRRFSSGFRMTDKTVFIDMRIHKGNKSGLYHIEITKDIQRIYTGDSAFVYIIMNSDSMLVEKIFNFIDKNTYMGD